MKAAKTNDEFFKSLTDAEWGQAEAIEAEIGKILKQGFTEEVGIKFVRTVMTIRRVIPDASVGGVFDLALSGGLTWLSDKDAIAKMCRGNSKQKSKLTGKGL